MGTKDSFQSIQHLLTTAATSHCCCGFTLRGRYWMYATVLLFTKMFQEPRVQAVQHLLLSLIEDRNPVSKQPSKLVLFAAALLQHTSFREMQDPDKYVTILFLFRRWHVTQISKDAYSSQVRFLMWEHRTQCSSQPTHLTSYLTSHTTSIPTTSIPNSSHLIPESHPTPHTSHLTFNATHLTPHTSHTILSGAAFMKFRISTNTTIDKQWAQQYLDASDTSLMNFSQFTMWLITMCI